MPLRPSLSWDFSTIRVLVLGLSTMLALAMSHPALAQAPTAAVSESSAKPGAVSKAKAKSKETWADMKARWAKQRERWADCQKREKAEKRTGKASRAFLEDCMTKQ
jgi:hypothetical protein